MNKPQHVDEALPSLPIATFKQYISLYLLDHNTMYNRIIPNRIFTRRFMISIYNKHGHQNVYYYAIPLFWQINVQCTLPCPVVSPIRSDMRRIWDIYMPVITETSKMKPHTLLLKPWRGMNAYQTNHVYICIYSKMFFNYRRVVSLYMQCALIENTYMSGTSIFILLLSNC